MDDIMGGFGAVMMQEEGFEDEAFADEGFGDEGFTEDAA
jgi:hypothetical protein